MVCWIIFHSKVFGLVILLLVALATLELSTGSTVIYYTMASTGVCRNDIWGIVMCDIGFWELVFFQYDNSP